MDVAMVRLRIDQALQRGDVVWLANTANILTKTIVDKKGGGYVVVNDHNRGYGLYYGSREECVAFIEGYDSAPPDDQSCFDNSVLCVCVDVPSMGVVIPEDRFGEQLGDV